MAEAQQLPGKPPVVTDDPVSSLDHMRRERVARRLVEEARERQVVVMTHDLLLYTDMIAKAAELRVPLRRYSLLRTQDGCGWVASGEPWPVKDVANRLHHPEHECLPEVVRLYETQEPTYRDQARAVGEMLREIWERLVEEDLFGSVVMRFRRSVNTLRLCDVEVQDDAWQEIHWGMARTSNWAHDQPAGTGDPPPTPDDLREEIGRIRGCHKALRGAWGQVRDRRKKLLEPPLA